MKIRMNPARRAFVIFNYIFCILIGLLCVIPVIHILAVSLSDKDAVFSGHVVFWPVRFTWENYEYVVRDAQFFRSYFVTIVRALMGWGVGIVVTMR